jgi:hypothetical protein
MQGTAVFGAAVSGLSGMYVNLRVPENTSRKWDTALKPKKNIDSIVVHFPCGAASEALSLSASLLRPSLYVQSYPTLFPPIQQTTLSLLRLVLGCDGESGSDEPEIY